MDFSVWPTARNCPKENTFENFQQTHIKLTSYPHYFGDFLSFTLPLFLSQYVPFKVSQGDLTYHFSGIMPEAFVFEMEGVICNGHKNRHGSTGNACCAGREPAWESVEGQTR